MGKRKPGLIALSLGWFFLTYLASEGTSTELTDDRIHELRKEAAWRERRVISNNDGDDATVQTEEPTLESFLDARTSNVVGTQVDTIEYSTVQSFGMFIHNTAIGEVFTATEEGCRNNRVKLFLDQGTDPLRLMVEFCHKNDIEIFWSMRMNDVHDAWGDWFAKLAFPKLKKDHPEYLVTRGDVNELKNGVWTAVDYTFPEIRDFAFRYVEEVCRNYDVDGVMLDFGRRLCFFRKNALGGEAGAEELDLMTGLLRRIRAMADEVGRERGRSKASTVGLRGARSS